MKVILIICIITVSLIMGTSYLENDRTKYRESEPVKVLVTDTVFISKDTCIGNGEFFIAEVIGTPYNPTVAQCDSTPYHTGDGSFIDTILLKQRAFRWCALSQDLLWFNSGPFHYGDTVWVYYKSEPIKGIWVVHDAMNKRHRMRIDFLQWFDSPIHTTHDIIITNQPI